MLPEKLRIGDFKREGGIGNEAHCFRHFTPDGREICLESCLGGYCVGVYRDEELQGEKTCTNIEGMMEARLAPGLSLLSGEALQKAVEIATKRYRETSFWMGVPVSAMPEGLLTRLQKGGDMEAAKEWDRLLKAEGKKHHGK